MTGARPRALLTGALTLVLVSGASALAVRESWQALAIGCLAGVASALLCHVVTQPLVGQLSRLTAAARAAQGEHAPDLDGGGDDASLLAKGVSALGARAREQDQNLNTLVAAMDAMAEGLWITQRDGRIIRHNRALKEMLFAGQDLLGQRPIAVLRSAELQDAVRRACAGEPSRLELGLEGVRPRLLSIQVTPLPPEIGGSAAIFHDVTELRRLEKVRKDFVANVSHELRTPITAIRGYAETLRAGALADATNAPMMVEIIHRQSERLCELVEDLLELSRLEAKELQLSHQAVPIAQATSAALEAVRPKAESKGIALSLSVPEGLVGMGDARAIEQVLLNLLDNAVKYTPANGRVELSARREDDRCVVRVHDTGIGIEAKYLSRIFERFYRVDKGRSRDTGGTGLGLSIVKHLVTAMSAEVDVQSEPGRGSCFVVRLRVPATDHAEQSDAARLT